MLVTIMATITSILKKWHNLKESKRQSTDTRDMVVVQHSSIRQNGLLGGKIAVTLIEQSHCLKIMVIKNEVGDQVKRST